jgi:hypothetical protein
MIDMSHNKNETLISALNDCASACARCATACLDEEHVKMMTACIKLDLDCADICKVTASFLARGSVHGKHLLKECAEICRACGDECSKHDMDHCQQCAEACRRCEEACRMAA